MDQKGSAVMLAIKRPVGDTLEVNLRNHTSERSTTASKPRADIQNRGTSDPTKGLTSSKILEIKDKNACGELRLTAMLASKRSAGVTPEVNLREHTSCMLLLRVNKAALSGFETQRRHHQKFKTGVSVAP